MPVTIDTPLDEVIGKLKASRETILALFAEHMSRIGEEAVSMARINGVYIDHTGNLRSSIGYAVLVDGKPWMKAYPQPAGSGTDPQGGVDKGSQYLDELVAKTDSIGKIVLIVTAGMDYAEYVERIETKDVLAQTELRTRTIAEARMQKLKAMAVRIANEN